MAEKKASKPVFEIKTCTSTIERKRVHIETTLRAWLEQHAPPTADTLLGFALDGVIWGKLIGGKLMVAHDLEQTFSRMLHRDTVQEVRLFGKSAELHLWRTDHNRFEARIITDDIAGNDAKYIDESQMLWGNQVSPINGDFTLMSDGIEGLRHAVPLYVPAPSKAQARQNNPDQYRERPLRLKVRNYLAKGEPFARIAHSRLVCVYLEAA